MRFQGFVGPSYTLKSVNIDCQRCVNLYPEMNEQGTGKAAEVAWLRSTPGLELLLTVGSGPIRLVHYDQTPVNVLNTKKRVFVVSGDTLYKLTESAGTWTASAFANKFSTSSGPVSAASNNVDLGQTVFVDGDNSYLFWAFDSSGYTESFNNFAAYGYGTAPSASQVISLDNYFIYNSDGTNNFWVSNLNDLTIDPLSYAAAEGDPDNVVSIISNQRELWVFNERTTEVYYNSGNADFPFERVSGGFLQNGILAKHSAKKIDNYVFWLGRDENGQGKIFAANGLNPQRISTHAVELAIQGYANPEDAVAFTYQSGGHSFYVLNFAEATWVFDLSTKLWHERAYTNSGSLERHRGQHHAFIPEYGIHMVGDYSNGKIYKFNDDYYTDDTDPITRMRTAPVITSELKRIFYNRFQLDMETGVGLDGGVQGSNPQIMLQFSDDGGHTWSSESWASAEQTAGAIGAYNTRVIWRRLGKSRNRVFRVKVTDPVKVAIAGAELDVVVGEG